MAERNERPGQPEKAGLPDAHDVARCQALFLETLPPEGGVYVLLDCQLGNPFGDYLEAEKLYVLGADQSMIEVHGTKGYWRNPRLLRIDKDSPILPLALEFAANESESPIGARNVCALLASAKKDDLALLTRHLKTQSRHHHLWEEQEDSVPFRYYDPRVMHTLRRLFTPRQIRDLLGPVLAWAYVDFRSNFHLFKHPRPDRIITQVKLTPENIAAFPYNQDVYRAMRLLEAYRDAWTDMLDVELFQILENAGKSHADDALDKNHWNLPTLAAVQWLIERGRADAEILEEALKAWRESGIPLLPSIEQHYAPGLFP
ncbi:MAG: DUF4123 domain-containing protein [Zoogloeaceae bacterium]|nr:DUF4123 domain-containing protein [Zoogloeaceae bacterium]